MDNHKWNWFNALSQKDKTAFQKSASIIYQQEGYCLGVKCSLCPYSQMSFLELCTGGANSSRVSEATVRQMKEWLDESARIMSTCMSGIYASSNEHGFCGDAICIMRKKTAIKIER